MKKTLFTILILSLAVFPLFVLSATVEESFDAYSDGDLNGNNGGTGWAAAWSANTAYDVQGVVTYNSTTKAIQYVNTGDGIRATREIASPQATGVATVWMRRNTTSPGGDFWFVLADGLTLGSDYGAIVGLDDNGDISLWHSAGYTEVDMGDYSADTWYQFEITYDCEAGTNGQFTVRWKADGGEYSASYGPYELHADIDTVTHAVIDFNGSSTDISYFDEIQMEESGGSDTCTQPAAQEIWAVSLADECHITTDTHYRGTIEFFGSGNFVIDGATLTVSSGTIPSSLQIKSGGQFQIMPHP